MDPTTIQEIAGLVAYYDKQTQQHGFSFNAETQLIDDISGIIAMFLWKRNGGDAEATKAEFLRTMGRGGVLGEIIRMARGGLRSNAGVGAKAVSRDGMKCERFRH